MHVEITKHLTVKIASALLLLFVTDSLTAHEAQQAVTSNEQATLSLKDVHGRPHSLVDYRGKIVVLNFWATWCRPCRDELPILASLDSRYRERGVEFIAASADEPATQKRVPEFTRKLKISFPVWVGATRGDLTRLDLGDALPATAIIDRNGTVVGRILGAVSHADLQKRIEWLLGDRETPAPLPLVNNHPTKPDH